MKPYRCILFDADDTLVDYAKDSERAFRAALCAVGREGDEEALDVLVRFDFGNWDLVGLCDVHLPHVRDNFHELYRNHVHDIFVHADMVCGFNGKANEAERAFMKEFSMPGQPMEGAEEVVGALKGEYRLYAATNGLSELQKTRLSAFGLDGIFVSEELGAVKPSPDYFSRIFEALGESAENCLFVGDSLSADIAGAQACGMDSVWLNRRGAVCPSGVREIRSLKELLNLL